LTISALIAAAAVVAVAFPLLRRPPTRAQSGLQAQRPQLDLLERRDRALAALSELEFDHRTGTIGDADYHRLLAPLRHEAAGALRLVDSAHHGGDRPDQARNRRRRSAPR